MNVFSVICIILWKISGNFFNNLFLGTVFRTELDGRKTHLVYLLDILESNNKLIIPLWEKHKKCQNLYLLRNLSLPLVMQLDWVSCCCILLSGVAKVDNGLPNWKSWDWDALFISFGTSFVLLLLNETLGFFDDGVTNEFLDMTERGKKIFYKQKEIYLIIKCIIIVDDNTICNVT